ncbi:MAG: DUF4185 domain-containing protein [Coxiellaceae bacterium]|nr:DUF4185 domain-containing protein [Coxiellaceae bacterium]
MKKTSLLGLLALLLIFSNSFAQSHCWPTFPYKNNWLGADSAYSIPLNSGRTLWLFGDTFYGSWPRKATQFIHNSVAISTCSPEFSLHYFFARGNTPTALFKTPSDSNIYYWPSDGFMYHNKLYIFLMRIKTTNIPGPFKFSVLGSTLATISNPQQPPSNWIIQYRNLSQFKNTLVGVATTRRNNYQYLFSTTTQPQKNATDPVYLIRLNLNQLDNGTFAFTYLTNKNRWQTHFNQSKSKIIISSGATEMGLSYFKKSQRWYSIYNNKLNSIAIQSAKHLTGPWSKVKIIKTLKPKQKDAFCYAAKTHPQFNQGRKLAISYVCNSSDTNTLLKTQDLYHPIMFQYKVN